jgi:hypothetical protein
VWRPYGNLERFALKPIELLVPPPGAGLVPWRSVASDYYRGALYRGEMGSAYLGLAGVAALAWLTVVSVRAARGRPPRRVPGASLAVIWIFAYSVVGGLNGIVGALGFVWLRATNRFSIWILALVLLWAAARLSRTSWTRHRGASILAAALATTVALADQLLPNFRPAAISQTKSVLASDYTLVRSLEAALPDGAMLFQLPVVDCPEGPPIRKAAPHEHLRPYLHSRRLRFTYGSDKGRPREAWQRRVEALEAEPMADALERMGFAGFLVNRKAYEDGARDLRERLAATGRREAFESPDRDFLFIRLRPAPSPSLPDEVVPLAPGSEGP